MGKSVQGLLSLATSGTSLRGLVSSSEAEGTITLSMHLLALWAEAAAWGRDGRRSTALCSTSGVRACDRRRPGSPQLSGSHAPPDPMTQALAPHQGPEQHAWSSSLTSTRWGVGLKPQRLHTWSLQVVQVL